MVIYAVVAFLSLIVAILSLILAILGKRHFYWVSALGIYVFSFIAGFSIGQLTVGLTFIPLALAIGYSLGWINWKSDYLLTVGVGILIGVISVMVIDDYYIFSPFWVLSTLVDMLVGGI